VKFSSLSCHSTFRSSGDSAGRLHGRKVDMSTECPEGWWRLREFRVNDAIIPVLPGTRVTARFHDGGVNGLGGCNTYGASYVKRPPHNIKIFDLMHTRMHCSGEGVMEQEERYFKSLISVEQCERKGDELWLTWKEGMQALVYVAEDVKTF
jgi:heat shock protein HslJ